MKHINFKIPIYDYIVDWIIIDNKDDSKLINNYLCRCNILGENKSDIINAIEREAKDGADTYRNLPIKRFCIIVYECTSEAIFINIINHEKRHLIDRIMEHCGINDIESPAYLDGYVSEVLYKKGFFAYKK